MRYFYVITIGTLGGPVSVSNTLYVQEKEVTSRQHRYLVVHAAACRQIRAAGGEVPDGAPTLFYTCELAVP